MSDLFMTSDALLSPCQTYRYWLTRGWGERRNDVVWVCLNPSVADASVDDPTVRRIVGFSRAWGYEGFILANLFALRSTDPADLRKAADPVGPDNDEHLRRVVSGRTVVVAWGAHGAYRDRGRAALGLLREAGVRPMCLGVTGSGQPKHPLYLAAKTSLVPYECPF